MHQQQPASFHQQRLILRVSEFEIGDEGFRYVQAAASAAVQAVLVASGALQEVESCPQMKEAMTPMFSADPWLKSCWLAAMKAG